MIQEKFVASLYQDLHLNPSQQFIHIISICHRKTSKNQNLWLPNRKHSFPVVVTSDTILFSKNGGWARRTEQPLMGGFITFLLLLLLPAPSFTVFHCTLTASFLITAWTLPTLLPPVFRTPHPSSPYHFSCHSPFLVDVPAFLSLFFPSLPHSYSLHVHLLTA